MHTSSGAHLVELASSFDDQPWHGFVVAESPALVVIHRVSDRFDLDGYCAFPREAVKGTTRFFAKLDLLERALRLKNQLPVVPHRLDASSMRRLMESAQGTFGVLVVEREAVNPGSVEVGTIRLNSDETYFLRWLDAKARWQDDDRPFRYRDVTRLEFGSEYEQTLLAVAASRASDA